MLPLARGPSVWRKAFGSPPRTDVIVQPSARNRSGSFSAAVPSFWSCRTIAAGAEGDWLPNLQSRKVTAVGT